MGGSGHIELSLALKFWEKNFHVDVIDKNKHAIKNLKNSILNFLLIAFYVNFKKEY